MASFPKGTTPFPPKIESARGSSLQEISRSPDAAVDQRAARYLPIRLIRELTTQAFPWCQTQNIQRATFFFFFFGCAVWNPMVIFFWASNWFRSCMKIIVIVQDGELCGYKMELCSYELWKIGMELQQCLTSGIGLKSTGYFEENITYVAFWVFQARIQNFQIEAFPPSFNYELIRYKRNNSFYAL